MTSFDLRQVFVETLGIPAGDVRDSLSMKGVESWDSLRHMQLIEAIERSYGIQLEFEEIVSMLSVGAIRKVLAARGIDS